MSKGISNKMRHHIPFGQPCNTATKVTVFFMVLLTTIILLYITIGGKYGISIKGLQEAYREEAQISE